MAEINGKKILSVNLSIFTVSETAAAKSISPPPIKSPKKFEESKGVVGLGILAAMNENDCKNFQDQFLNRNAVLAVSPKSSNPIPILSCNNMGKRPSVEEMESCEEYTCVISHFGDNQIKKREYFDDGVRFEKKNYVKITANSSPPLVSDDQKEEFQMADFLSSCFRCKKQLHGLDIFMYRGEKAFCSAECRCKQLARDERKEKRVSKGRKAQEYSVSPCSGTMHCFVGIAAA